ncbi:hypothetical protein HAX54_030981 [Datura stramonium]|uniref:Uncharacterized protein n=1 Tax=Datura stramonium TaxID=4076 RepID=A0ABS8V990_DATST|nr:hypothetical protein [Datura stramonium]
MTDHAAKDLGQRCKPHPEIVERRVEMAGLDKGFRFNFASLCSSSSSQGISTGLSLVDPNGGTAGGGTSLCICAYPYLLRIFPFGPAGGTGGGGTSSDNLSSSKLAQGFHLILRWSQPWSVEDEPAACKLDLVVTAFALLMEFEILSSRNQNQKEAVSLFTL